MRKNMGILLLCLCLLRGLIPVSADASQWGVPVSGINILNTDVTGNPLEGASFQIARELREGELTDHAVEKQFLRIGEENRIMAIETFWSDRSMAGEKKRVAVTDEEGKVSIYGLTYGTYYLVEREAADGYNRMTEPIRIAVHKYSHLTAADHIYADNGSVIDNTLHIVNVRYTLPDTGNWGMTQLTVAGSGVVFSSIALIVLNRRRWY